MEGDPASVEAAAVLWKQISARTGHRPAGSVGTVAEDSKFGAAEGLSCLGGQCYTALEQRRMELSRQLW